jgi:predicted ATPase/transcriptional regulator with XRE-family HTH domain
MPDNQPQQADRDRDTFFGPWLRRRRRELDFTQDALAQQVGCAADTVRKLETGMRRPSRAMAERLALCLSIPAEERDSFIAAARTGRVPLAHGPAPAGTAATAAVPLAEPTTRTTPPRTGRLPAPLTSFIGREWEIATLAARLGTPDVRLLTLTGAGGIGKTRLALQIGSVLHDAFPSGVWFVDLAPIGDPALVISMIAQTLGVREQHGVRIADTLCAALRDQHLLLLLDNFEQVIAAAPEPAQLLAEVPGMKLLVTSREALRLSGEHVVVVAPLAVPDPGMALAAEHLTHYAAAQLFVARAQAASADFRLTDANASAVAAICARLDGLPLAIELAAAWVPLFPPAALLTRLERRLPILTRGPRDVAARQQTIRNTIDWSYHLLEAGEQTLFARLGVFVGGCTLEAAEGVCNADHDLPVAVLDGLVALVDKSLLQQAGGAALRGYPEPRFTMLETIREYALERLAASGETEVLRRRHATYFLALAEMAEPHLSGRNQVIWSARLEQEHDNLRAVFAWSRSVEDDAATGMHLAGALYWFWMIHSHFSEARIWLDDMLDMPNTAVPAAHAKALQAAGAMAANQGEVARSIMLHEESLALYRGLSDAAGTAEALLWLGRAKVWQGAYAQAHSLLVEGLAMFQVQQNTWMIMWALQSLGNMAFNNAEVLQAHAYFQEALVLCSDLGDMFGSAHARENLGRVAYALGDNRQAQTYYAESLAAFRELGQRDIAQVYVDLGQVARTQGDITQARIYYTQGLALFREFMDKQRFPECLEDIAGLAGAAQPAGAVRLFGAAEAVRESAGIPLPPVRRAAYERDLAAARAQLDQRAWETAWAAGRALSLEQAIAEALDLISADDVSSRL